MILITAAGGAFGAMLREAGIQEPIQAMMGGSASGAGIGVLLSGAAVASLIKFAQGSGTVAMITASSMFRGHGFRGPGRSTSTRCTWPARSGPARSSATG